MSGSAIPMIEVSMITRNCAMLRSQRAHQRLLSGATRLMFVSLLLVSEMGQRFSTARAEAGPAALRIDREVEHHPALVVLGDVAVRHPDAGVCDVEKDVDRLASRDEHCVFPDEVRLDDPVAGEDQEAAGTVDVERMMHWMVRVHLVDDPDLHLVADAEAPVDRVTFRSGVSVDEL